MKYADKKLQVTWCYPVEGNQQYCATGFPMGCYVDKNGNPQVLTLLSFFPSLTLRYKSTRVFVSRSFGGQSIIFLQG
jgi:hypothetical protein